ncbi:MAG: iron uptake transporter deferrochelatase/peroxidase subunit [Bacillaceae bacterium]
MSLEKESTKKYSRREMIKLSAMTGVGVAIAASGVGFVTGITDGFSNDVKADQKNSAKESISFYGKHQAGIVTEQQTNAYIAAFNLLTNDKNEVIQLFKDWTMLSAALSQGNVKTVEGANDFLPPADTGESEDLSASYLTITFGLGATFFVKDGKDRFGLASKKPIYLQDIPKMNGEVLQKQFVGGDICIQVCANDQQVAFHAIRNLMRAASSVADIQWIQAGFLHVKEGKTPRNLFGFKDGTANPAPKNKDDINNIVWANEGEPNWMQGGTYMACRKIQMMLEVWDRSSLKAQEDTFGRKKMSGAPYGKANEHDTVDMSQQPINSHVKLSKESGEQIYRRAYSYTDGLDPTTGHMNSGLMFISFQKNPQKQFIPMLKKLAQGDALNEYIKHIGSAMFACPKGVAKGEYIAQGLLER